MNPVDYVSAWGNELGARVTTFALTDQRIQTSAQFLAILRSEIGPEALGVAAFAWEFQKLRSMLEAPGVEERGIEDPDGVGQELIDSYLDEHLEAATDLLEICAQGSWARVEGPVPDWLLQRQQEERSAQEREHASQLAALEEQLDRSRARFDELHRQDSAEEREPAKARFDEAERQARTELETAQAAERQAREEAERVTREALQSEEHQIEENEAKAAAERQAQAAREAQEQAEREVP
ncbi:MAG: hypothetical protein ABW065_13820 [Solirubrobacterales bacterium]